MIYLSNATRDPYKKKFSKNLKLIDYKERPPLEAAPLYWIEVWILKPLSSCPLGDILG
jgi:hypothetical protein